MERSLRVLRQLRTRGRNAFVSDEAVQDRADHNAQLLAQACADIALHVIAASGTAAPETYAEALIALGATGVVPEALAARLSGAVRLRNILVHAYLDVDHGRLFDELGWIEDAAEFAAVVDRWLTQHAEKQP
jgi:uncharacterized protein YutE (UPF0331/DUF86 family)